LSIAQRLSRNDERARFLTADNKVGRWVDIPDAVASGKPFMITVEDDILTLDIDHRNQYQIMRDIIGLLHSWGVEPVVVASGQEGHRHLFAWIESHDHLEFVRTMSRKGGIDVRESRHIRPPLSPHRLGLQSRLIRPANRQKALAALARRPTRWPELPTTLGRSGNRPIDAVQVIPGPLTPRIQALLHDGDNEGRYQSRSELEMAVLTGMARAGWGFDEVVAAMLDLDNAAGYRLRELVEDRGEDHALVSLERSYDKATEYARASPSVSPGVVGALRLHADTWTGRTGHSDLTVYQKMLDHVEQANTFEVNASIRQLVDETGLCKGTVIRVLNRLQPDYLQLVSSGAGTMMASVYRVTTDQVGGDVHVPSDPPSSHPQYLLLGGSIEDPAHDVWANRSGLGKYAHRIHREVLNSPNSVAALSESSVCGTEKTIRKHLQCMENFGLVSVDDAGVWTGHRVSDAKAHQIAEEIGSAGRAERLREGHERERVGYAAHTRRKDERAARRGRRRS